MITREFRVAVGSAIMAVAAPLAMASRRLQALAKHVAQPDWEEKLAPPPAPIPHPPPILATMAGEPEPNFRLFVTDLMGMEAGDRLVRAFGRNPPAVGDCTVIYGADRGPGQIVDTKAVGRHWHVRVRTQAFMAPGTRLEG